MNETLWGILFIAIIGALFYFIGQAVLAHRLKLPDIRKKSLIKIGISIGLFLILVIVSGLSTDNQQQESETTAPVVETTTQIAETTTESPITEEVTFSSEGYGQVDFNAWNHDEVTEGTKVKIQGEILQVMREDGLVASRVAIDRDIDKTVLAVIEETEYEKIIAEGDLVTFYGRTLGLHDYDTVWGNKQTVPLMGADWYTIDAYKE